MDAMEDKSDARHSLPFILNPFDPATPTDGVTTSRPKHAQEKKRGRMCRVESCRNYIVHKGLCCKHGGGKKCSVESCSSSAKHGGRCWKHGGSVACKVANCEKKAKARGLCWSHGGGTLCRAPSCSKVAVSSGFCWHHGGGKRCLMPHCQRPAYARTENYCERHYEELQFRRRNWPAAEMMLL